MKIEAKERVWVSISRRTIEVVHVVIESTKPFADARRSIETLTRYDLAAGFGDERITEVARGLDVALGRALSSAAG